MSSVKMNMNPSLIVSHCSIGEDLARPQVKIQTRLIAVPSKFVPRIMGRGGMHVKRSARASRLHAGAVKVALARVWRVRDQAVHAEVEHALDVGRLFTVHGNDSRGRGRRFGRPVRRQVADVERRPGRGLDVGTVPL